MSLSRLCWHIVIFAVVVGPGVLLNAQTRSLKVLSYNIHHGRGLDDKVDLSRIAKVIRDSGADLVALQEVDFKTRRTNQVDQTSELSKLTELQGQFVKAIDYEGGEYGQAVLSKYKIVKFDTLWLPGEPDRERRIVGICQVDIDGRELTFATTHLHHANADFRLQQAQAINEHFKDSSDPIIMAGDLNAVPDSPPIAELSKLWRFAAGEDLFSFPAERPQRQIDYIAVRSGGPLVPVSAEIIDEAQASDHRPILSVIQWPQE